MPSPDLWAEFPALAVGVLLAAGGWIVARYAFRELTGWLAQQNTERDRERERQRAWEATQAEAAEKARNERDERQRVFFDTINQRNIDAINGNGQAIEKLIETIGKLLDRLDGIDRRLEAHDKQARDGFAKLAPNAKRDKQQ